MPPESLLGSNTLRALVRLAEEPPRGPIVEVGVYKGGSAWHLAQVARKRGVALHLFDSFKGHPIACEIDLHRIGEFAAPEAPVREAVPDAIFHVGTFPETLPQVEELDQISMAHIDCDQRDSVAACIEHLWPRMMPKGIMVFDDYEDLEGARFAVDAAVERGFLPPLKKFEWARPLVVKPW